MERLGEVNVAVQVGGLAVYHIMLMAKKLTQECLLHGC